MANDCRAKDPSSCRVHGTSGTYEKLQAVADTAAANGDSALYMKTRAEMDALSDDDNGEPKLTAAEKAKKIRAELAEAEKAEKEERAAKRRAERELRVAEDNRKADEYREENYEFSVGGNSEYLGVTSNYDGGVEVAISEWSSRAVLCYFSKEQAQALMENLQRVLK